MYPVAVPHAKDGEIWFAWQRLSLRNKIQATNFFALSGGLPSYETTSSTLCFIYYFLCNNPDKLRKAREEVDQIVGDKVLSYDMLRQLRYLDAVMKEPLSLQHPVSLPNLWRKGR
jgi:hypothetical protein